MTRVNLMVSVEVQVTIIHSSTDPNSRDDVFQVLSGIGQETPPD